MPHTRDIDLALEHELVHWRDDFNGHAGTIVKDESELKRILDLERVHSKRWHTYPTFTAEQPTVGHLNVAYGCFACGKTVIGHPTITGIDSTHSSIQYGNKRIIHQCGNCNEVLHVQVLERQQ